MQLCHQTQDPAEVLVLDVIQGRLYRAEPGLTNSRGIVQPVHIHEKIEQVRDPDNTPPGRPGVILMAVLMKNSFTHLQKNVQACPGIIL